MNLKCNWVSSAVNWNLIGCHLLWLYRVYSRDLQARISTTGNGIAHAFVLSLEDCPQMCEDCPQMCGGCSVGGEYSKPSYPQSQFGESLKGQPIRKDFKKKTWSVLWSSASVVAAGGHFVDQSRGYFSLWFTVPLYAYNCLPDRLVSCSERLERLCWTCTSSIWSYHVWKELLSIHLEPCDLVWISVALFKPGELSEYGRIVSIVCLLLCLPLNLSFQAWLTARI